MSISSTTNRVTYTGNDAVDTYDYTFRIFTESDLLVTVKNTSTGVETALVISTDYTVTGVGEAAGGTIVLVNAAQDWLDGDGDLSIGYTIVIRRMVELTQTTDIRNQGDFFPEVHEDTFDFGRMIDQQQQDSIDRSVKNPEAVPTSVFDPTLPVDIATASVSVVTNSDGNGWVLGPTIAEIAGANASAIAAAASAVAAGVSETNAAASETAAGVSETNAAASETAAGVSETNAAASEAAAASAVSDYAPAKATLTTKGDLYAASAASTVTRLGVGTDGQVLTAASGQTTGLQWSSPGATSLALATKTAAYTLLASDDVIVADASSGGFTLTLPAAASNSGKVFDIRRAETDTTSNSLLIDGNASETIDGETTFHLTRYLRIISDGSNWISFKEKNRIETKILSSNLTSDIAASSLTCSNLIIGLWYEISGQVRVVTDDSASDTGVGLNVQHDGSTIGSILKTLNESTDTSSDTSIYGLSLKFQATATSLTFVGSSCSANSYVDGNTARNGTYIQIEERSDLITTTAF